MSAAPFTIERVDTAHLRLRGRLGFAEAATALPRSREWLADGQRRVEMDVGALQAVDSATLAVLLAWAAHAARAGVSLHLSHVPDDLRALAQLCAAEPLLGIG